MEQTAWYYQQNGQQIGPVSQQELQNLLIQQIITPQTYVWTEGMENWQQIVTMGGFTASGAFSPQPVRPTSMKVLGILNIVFGALGLLCMPIIIIGIMVPQPDSPLQMGPGMKIYTAIALVLRLILALLLLASGIGLLNLKEWARKAASFYGWSAIVMGIIGTAVTVITMSSAFAGVPEHEAPAVIGGTIGGMCGGILGLTYPIILIVFMKRPNIIEACKE